MRKKLKLRKIKVFSYLILTENKTIGTFDLPGNNIRRNTINKLYKEAESYIVQILNCYEEMQRKKHNYTKEVSLYPSEIHAIVCIAESSTINMTELSKQLGVTKGAVTKIVVKLEKQGLVRRYKYVSNRKEVYLHLTELGAEAYSGHNNYHALLSNYINDYCANISKEEGLAILSFLKFYLEGMHKLSGEN